MYLRVVAARRWVECLKSSTLFVAIVGLDTLHTKIRIIMLFFYFTITAPPPGRNPETAP